MKPRYAGFTLRSIANIIDSGLLSVAAWLVEWVVLKIFSLFSGDSMTFEQAFSSLALQILNVGFYFCLAFPYYVGGHYRWGTTLGKVLFRIRVVNAGDFAPISLKQSVLRFVGYGASYAIFGAGFLMAAFHPEKRGLHDLIAGTVSIRGSRKKLDEAV